MNRYEKIEKKYCESLCVCGYLTVTNIKLVDSSFTSCGECGKLVEMNFLDKGYVIIEEEHGSDKCINDSTKII